MLIPHTPLIQEKKKEEEEEEEENQQLVRAELHLHVLSWTQRTNALESPMPAMVGPPGTVSFPPQHTQNTLTAALWSEKAQERENVKEVSSVISFQRGERRRTGYCIWILRTKPETQPNKLLWVTCFYSLYWSQYHWPLHFFVQRYQGMCVECIPASPTEHWFCHFEMSVGFDPFPNPFLKSPLGVFSFNIFLILVLCGYSYQ